MPVLSFKKGSRPNTDFPPEVLRKPPGLHGPKVGMGRPPILNEEMIDAFEELLPKVAYIETAGDLLGIHRHTWRNWIKEGRIEKVRLAKDPTATPYPSRVWQVKFLDCYLRSMAQFQHDRLTVISDSDQWQAHLALLERRFPDQWGSQTREINELKRELAKLEKEVAAAGGNTRHLPVDQDEESEE